MANHVIVLRNHTMKIFRRNILTRIVDIKKKKGKPINTAGVPVIHGCSQHV